ncbi:phosphatase PAP2 family protein [Deinococcus peraridilitoris]|nr:phosphatase PAP2 family protein [Deinococcus peraridilitoris]
MTDIRLPASLHAFLRTYGNTLLLSFLLAFIPLGVLAFVAAHFSGADGFAFEQPLQQWIRSQRTSTRDVLAVALHVIGGVWGMMALGLVTTIALYRLQPRLAWLLLSSMLGTALIGVTLRFVFDRPRPAGDSLVSEPDGSFPSGHVMVLTALVVVLCAVVWPTKARSVAVAIGAVVVVMMMWSRVYAGVHHVTDVVAGALFALVWTVGLTRATRAHQVLRQGAPGVPRARP